MVSRPKRKRPRGKSRAKRTSKKPKEKKKVKKKKRLTIKQKARRIFLNQIIKDKLLTLINDKGLELLKILLSKRQINEFKLAKKLKLKVNKVRSLLYKLYSEKIVSYTRKRDKRKGWYIYTWKIDQPRVVDFVIDELKKDIKVLEGKYKIRTAGKEFFVCKECAIQLNMVKALETNYLCPYCERPLERMDVEKIKNEILDQVNELNKKINSIEHLK
jgi:transcription factor E